MDNWAKYVILCDIWVLEAIHIADIVPYTTLAITADTICETAYRMVFKHNVTDVNASPDQIQCCSANTADSALVCVAGKRNVYYAHEEELFHGLAALINDAKNVRIYLASLMRAQSQAFGAALA